MPSAVHRATIRQWAALPLHNETNLLYIAALATLVLGGSGPFAFDRLRAVKSGHTSSTRKRADDHAGRASV